MKGLSQDKSYKIKEVLLNADSVIFVSHEITAGILIQDEKTGKRKPPPRLIVNNKINQSIIHEKLRLKGNDLDSLISILARPFHDTIISVGNCYMPHHTILVMKKSKISFIEICFGCRNYETSKDLNFFEAFDKRKWEELENFLINHNFKYALTDDTEQ